MLDGRVVTDIEVKKRMFLGASPVAAIHRLVIAHIEGAGDDLAVALGEHQAEMRGKALVQFVKKFLGQILPAVIQPVDVALV